MENIILVGPWVGEEQYESFWIEFIKKELQNYTYDKLIIGCRQGNEYKYKDLNPYKFIIIDTQGIKKENLLNGKVITFNINGENSNKKIIQINAESKYFENFEIYNRKDSKIHLLWATIRPEMFKATYKFWMDNCDNKDNIKLHVAVDNEEDGYNLENVIVVNNPKPGVTYPSYILAKNLVANDNDIVIFASDDFYPCKSWDTLILQQFKTFEGNLIVNDNHILKYEPNKKIDIIALPIMSYKTLKLLNFVIYHPSYNHLCSDKELFDNLEELNLIKDISRSNPNIYIEHRHWSVGRRICDTSDIQHKEKFEEDLINYNIRKYLPIKDKLKIDNKIIYIYHNLGLGDHILCNGLIRKTIKPNNTYKLFCKPHNFDSVKFMYRDLKNLEVVEGSDELAERIYNSKKFEFIKMDYKAWPWNPNLKPLEGETNIIHTFARLAGVKFEDRWDSFHFVRDYDRENELFEKFGLLKDSKYIFIHHDPNRNMNINYNLITSSFIKIVPKSETTNIFDYCKILENAEEIHCMDSSFKILCEHLNVTKNLYYHHYVKNSDTWGIPQSNKNWKIL